MRAIGLLGANCLFVFCFVIEFNFSRILRKISTLIENFSDPSKKEVPNSPQKEQKSAAHPKPEDMFWERFSDGVPVEFRYYQELSAYYCHNNPRLTTKFLTISKQRQLVCEYSLNNSNDFTGRLSIGRFPSEKRLRQTLIVRVVKH